MQVRNPISSVLTMVALGAFVKNQEDKKKQNECGGILAFVTNKKEEVTDSEMSSLISRPARITPGLTCDNKDRIVGGTEVFHSYLSTQFNH